MLAGILITLREGVEAFLVVGILLGYLRRMRAEKFRKYVWLGLALAGVLAYLVFKTLIRVNLRNFFIFTGLLLILIASGLLAHTVMAFREMGTVPGIWGEVVWNTNLLIDEDGFWGRLLHAFVGYDGDPVLLEVIFYFGYLLIFGGWFLKEVRKPATA